MKQPTQMWQLVVSIITILLTCGTGILTNSNKVERLQNELENLKMQQYNMQIASDKKFDKIDNKIDLIQVDTRQILVVLATKQDKK